MPTNVDENGTYPLPDDALDMVERWAIEKASKFNNLWKDHFSFRDPVGKMTYEEREVMKKFALEVWLEALGDIDELNDHVNNEVQDVADIAYADGEKDGTERAEEAQEEKEDDMNDWKEVIRQKAQEILDELED